MNTKAWMLPCLILVAGCATPPRKPRWEIVVTLGVESQLDKQTKTKGTVEFRRTKTTEVIKK